MNINDFFDISEGNLTIYNFHEFCYGNNIIDTSQLDFDSFENFLKQTNSRFKGCNLTLDDGITKKDIKENLRKRNLFFRNNKVSKRRIRISAGILYVQHENIESNTSTPEEPQTQETFIINPNIIPQQILKQASEEVALCQKRKEFFSNKALTPAVKKQFFEKVHSKLKDQGILRRYETITNFNSKAVLKYLLETFQCKVAKPINVDSRGDGDQEIVGKEESNKVESIDYENRGEELNKAESIDYENRAEKNIESEDIDIAKGEEDPKGEAIDVVKGKKRPDFLLVGIFGLILITILILLYMKGVISKNLFNYNSITYYIG
ncbi:hypothetical protein BN7_2958 [Wickerhamomyces ciferrii]|uniref:Uncharacterized protein n=1 Tax=Wickerhamomyces ciferrii (strain ATCC 14091 / BCRC 22168 / CBS 111 / JCM 3599 / NBRC 0793 / NRRL Y-1031 F-60-10) TaxID=1206466 RepID=K0KE78_WICCF|nr:uncharacterized protein BN7_2958 [Wickerhamomyces ciferrii]CCH43410.1 hypothetical protein BN7_2958 [Wickerhamomyces ciferrii]